MEQNYTEAFRYYKLACDNGVHIGCTNLGFLYENGQGVEQNYTEAFRYYKLACDNGEYRGCYNLGGLYAPMVKV